MNTEDIKILNMPELSRDDLATLADISTITTMPTELIMDYSIDLPVDDDIIGFDLLESDADTKVIIKPEFVDEYFRIARLVEKLSTQMEEAKSIIKRFIEEHDTGSVESNGMFVKYTPPTTTTTLDTTKIKSKYPEIAAECSKVSARKSSISIKENN